MKKIKFLSLGAIALAGITIASCSGSNNLKSTKEVYANNNDGNVAKISDCELLFKKGSDIPYISLDEGTALMSVVRSRNMDNNKYNYTLKKEKNSQTISNEMGAKCVVNKENQTLTFDDFDAFTSLSNDKYKPLTICFYKEGKKALNLVSSTYTKGKKLTFDLKPYSKLEILEDGDRFYIPLSVYNSALLNTNMSVYLGYNGKDMFFINGESLTTNVGGMSIESALGSKFRDGAAKDRISDEFKEYNYQSMCFDFNNLYGLTDKFKSFEEFLESGNCKDGILSNNPKEIDNYTAIALTNLVDGHSALTGTSNLYPFGEGTIDKTKLNPVRSKWDEDGEALDAAKKKAGIEDGLDYKDNTAFVSFAEFNNIDEDLLYMSQMEFPDFLDDLPGLDDIPGLDFKGASENPALSNTACLFSQLYKDLTSDEYKNKIKNVVIDLTTNQGGAADALIYALSTLVGNVSVDMINPKSGAHGNQVYKADMNADGKIDENDKPLCDLGFNIYFLNSKYSFSSANAMPVLAKANNSKIIMLGDKTAGGPCAVRMNINPIGSVLSSSSLSTIATKVNDKYENIDGGIKADYTLTEAQMLDRSYIVQNISKWTNK